MTAIRRIVVEAGPVVFEEPASTTSEPTTTAPSGAVSHHPTERASRAERREAMRAGDDDRLASLMLVFSEPESLFHVAQSMMRDSQTNGRQHDTETRQAAARIQEALRSDEITRALADARESKSSSDIANVFKVIGAALSAAVGVVGAMFTGGASVVAAVGLIIALVGPMVCDALAEAEILPRDVALGIGVAVAAIGTALSFGAGAAGGAAQIANSAVKVALEATKWSLRVASATASQLAAGFSVHAGVENVDSLHHMAEATGAEARREAANESADLSSESLALLMRIFARVGERLREIRESRAESMSNITGALARA